MAKRYHLWLRYMAEYRVTTLKNNMNSAMAIGYRYVRSYATAAEADWWGRFYTRPRGDHAAFATLKAEGQAKGWYPQEADLM
jgi:hypothetical protein